MRDTTATGTSCSLLRSLALERRRGLSLVVVWTPCSLFGCVAARAFSGPAAHVPRAAPRAYGTGRGSADARVGPRPRARVRARGHFRYFFLVSRSYLARRPLRRRREPRYRGRGAAAVTVAAPCATRAAPYAPPYACTGAGVRLRGLSRVRAPEDRKEWSRRADLRAGCCPPQAQRRAAAIDRAAARAAPWTSATRAATLRVA